MKKRKSVDVIKEKTSLLPHLEKAFVKFPGQETTEVTLSSQDGGVSSDKELIEELKNKYGSKYSHIHTHPTPNKWFNAPSYPLPSVEDLKHFLINLDATSMVIAQQDSTSGEIAGYYVLRKTKKSKKFLEENKDRINQLVEAAISETHTELTNETTRKLIGKKIMKRSLESLNKFYNSFYLKERYLPAQGYQLSDDKTHFTPKEGGLEQIAYLFLPIGIVSIISSLFFVSSSFTGYSIFSFSSRTISILGVLFFIMGTLLLYFSFKKK
ncbi:hypothetical protein J4456_03540 [Candidatus Pacearchaeota archaeon]|nr:hypothetical protein [Candidatus Pacearchaeota archaeon]